MTFTDEDLKRLKEGVNIGTWTLGYHALSALLARLEAAERVAHAADSLVLSMRMTDSEINPCYIVEVEQVEKTLDSFAIAIGLRESKGEVKA